MEAGSPTRPWIVPLREAAAARLEGIERFELGLQGRALAACAGLPSGYAKGRRRHYPLLITLNLVELFGAAVEMSRLLAGSREVGRCVVVNVGGIRAGDLPQLAEVVARCRQRYRIDAREIAVVADGTMAHDLLAAFRRGIAGVTRCMLASARATMDAPPVPGAPLAWTVMEPLTGAELARHDVRWHVAAEASSASLALPALLHGLRTFWSTGHDYGIEIMPLASPAVARIACALAPVLRPLTRRRRFAPQSGSRHVVRSRVMQRDFEIFIALPPPAEEDPGRRYPAIVALDANGGFATVSEIAARLARTGEIEPALVIGIGVPRAQGELEYGFRRFEEFSPPLPPQDDAGDGLARFFRALFALRGEDARVQLGQAPGFHRFIVDELLPQLVPQLPLDTDALMLLGHSAGGTFVGYALAQADSPFTRYACLSPGVNVSGQWMLRRAAAPLPPQSSAARVYGSIGSAELDNRFNRLAGIPMTRAYIGALAEQGAQHTQFHVLDGETHTSVYVRAVAHALRMLLPRRAP
ncbi:MAG TPA: alpha/beta hydrolase-fold protein [Nevskiaceae bacterium]|nr:alpha/beta hydrolase-fold protein [Nevskiaceae bacterium]